LQDGIFDLIVTSPPYYNARQYAQWATYQDYVDWLGKVMVELARTLKPCKRLCWNICDYALETDDGTFAAPISADSIKAAERAGLRLRHWLVWSDPAALARRSPTGTFPRGPSVVLHHSLEFVIVFQKPGKNGKYLPLPTELEPYNQMGPAFFRERVQNQIWSINRKSDKNHPAVFPEELVEPLIRMWSRPGDLVFDPFAGSCTTAISAMLWRRNFFGYELNEKYFEYGMGRIRRRQIDIASDSLTKDLFDLSSDQYTDNEIRARQLRLSH